MTVFLIILAVIVSLGTAALTMDVSFRVSYDGELRVTFGVGPYRRLLYPSKDPKIRLGDYSIASLRKKRERAARKAVKERKPKVAQGQTGTAKKKRKSITASLRYYLRVIKIVAGKLGDDVRISVKSFAVTVATSDAAQTAIAYGYASQTAAYIFAYLEDRFDLSYTRGSHTGVFCDFTSESPAFDLDVSVKIKTWQLISAVTAGMKALSAQH